MRERWQLKTSLRVSVWFVLLVLALPGMRIGMTLTYHPPWFPVRGPDSFPDSLSTSKLIHLCKDPFALLLLGWIFRL